MVMSTHKLNNLPRSRRTNEPRFDYRMGTYDEDNWYVDENDNSLVTFRGHKVLRTLIRCHFSPPGSTNSRYVYSGSEDGKVYIWNMDATLAGTVDVYSATKNSRPPGNDFEVMGWDDDEGWRTCIRDASWHPNAPMIVGKFIAECYCVTLANISKLPPGAVTEWALVPVLSILGMMVRRKTRQNPGWA